VEKTTHREALLSPLLTKYYSDYQLKKTEMGIACSTHGERISAYRVLVENPDGRTLLERDRRRWENNIKMDLREMEWWGMDWIDLAQDGDRCGGPLCRQ
jgi:hypothetical protein